MNKGAYNYQNATALIVTFTVNNHVNDADNKQAKEWERGFLEYIKNYNSTNMTVAYSAEVSGQVKNVLTVYYQPALGDMCTSPESAIFEMP